MKLEQARKSRGWSQSELARQAQLNASTICQIERGNQFPFESQRLKIADALEMRVEDIDFGRKTSE